MCESENDFILENETDKSETPKKKTKRKEDPVAQYIAEIRKISK